MNRPPKLYFSFHSPYSWLAVHRLRQTIPDLFEAVRFVPFWDPDPTTLAALSARGAAMLYQPMSRAKHRYLLADTKRLAARLGLPMAWPVDVDPWWEVPHLAWLAARRAGAASRCYDALVAARWTRGENICDPAVLRRVADGAGLPGAELADAVHDQGVRAEAVDALAAAYDDDVFGIPYLLLGRDRFWGVDRVDAFLDVYRTGAVRTGSDPLSGVPPAVLAAGGYDRDTAGGCG